MAVRVMGNLNLSSTKSCLFRMMTMELQATHISRAKGGAAAPRHCCRPLCLWWVLASLPLSTLCPAACWQGHVSFGDCGCKVGWTAWIDNDNLNRPQAGHSCAVKAPGSAALQALSAHSGMCGAQSGSEVLCHTVSQKLPRSGLCATSAAGCTCLPVKLRFDQCFSGLLYCSKQ